MVGNVSLRENTLDAKGLPSFCVYYGEIVGGKPKPMEMLFVYPVRAGENYVIMRNGLVRSGSKWKDTSVKPVAVIIKPGEQDLKQAVYVGTKCVAEEVMKNHDVNGLEDLTDFASVGLDKSNLRIDFCE